MRRNQCGFGVAGVFVVLLSLGIVGFSTWYFLRTDSDNKVPSKHPTTAISKPTTETSETKEDAKFITPSNYIVYKNTDFGFNFAYPQAVGELAPADAGGNPSYIVYYKSVGSNDAFIAHTQSPLYVSINKIDGYVLSAAKYGPMLEYEDSKWIVSDEQGGAVNHSGYAVGDIFPAKTIKTINANPVYDFSYTDEGCHRTRWVFKKDRAFVHIMLPAVCADSIDTIPQDRLDAYQKESDTVLESLQIER